MKDLFAKSLGRKESRLHVVSESTAAHKKSSPLNEESFVLGYQDSNLEKQDQNLLCYHYTIAHCPFCDCKFSDLFSNPQIFIPFFRREAAMSIKIFLYDGLSLFPDELPGTNRIILSKKDKKQRVLSLKIGMITYYILSLPDKLCMN